MENDSVIFGHGYALFISLYKRIENVGSKDFIIGAYSKTRAVILRKKKKNLWLNLSFQKN